MANLGGWEILLIALLVVLLFGAKKLPEAARSLGRSMRIFKSEVKEMSNDGNQVPAEQAQIPPVQQVQQTLQPGQPAAQQVPQQPQQASAPQNPQQGYQQPQQ